MKINIRKRIFVEDPALRFSRSLHCSPNVWREVWKRYKFLDYTKEEAREYITITLNKKISKKRFNRWVDRTEVYTKAQLILKKDVKEVSSEYFGKLKDFVENQVTKNQ